MKSAAFASPWLPSAHLPGPVWPWVPSRPFPASVWLAKRASATPLAGTVAGAPSKAHQPDSPASPLAQRMNLAEKLAELLRIPPVPRPDNATRRQDAGAASRAHPCL